MAENYLTPDSYLPQTDDEYDDDPRALYRRPPGNRTTTGGFGMSGASLGVRPGPAAAAFERTFFGTLDTSRYKSPQPQENVTHQPTITPEASPNRGGFNQAEGIARPDYSRGDELRKQAYDLQHPSWWKKLVNGDEGLASQAAHKQQLAEYEDLAAERKFRWDHPEAFRQPTKLEHVSPGSTLYDPAQGKSVYTAPAQDKATDWEDTYDSRGKRIWANRTSGKTRPFMVRNAEKDNILSTDDPNIPEEVQDTKAPAPRKGKPFTKLFEKVNDDGTTTVGLQDDEGNISERRFGNTGKKTPQKGGGKGAGANREWTPQELEKAAERIASKRRAAAATGDPVEIHRTESAIKASLNSGGLEEDDLTGEISPRKSGSAPKALPDTKNPPKGTIRTDRETGAREIFLPGRGWQPFTGAKGTGR